MASVTITIEGFDAIVKKYGTAAADAAVNTALGNTVEYTATLVKAKVAGKHHITGFLLSSIKGSASSHDGHVYSEHGAGVYYAAFVEHGTGVYGPLGKPIVPKTAKIMSWHGKSATGVPGQNMIFARSVKGQPPVRMFHNTFTLDREKIAQHFSAKFRQQFLKE